MRSNNFLRTKGVFLLGLLIMLLKLFIIDMDPPVWKETLYQPIDEPYYVYPAYNYFETGDLFMADNAVVFGNSILLNVITYFSLDIFGDNYMGLRFSSILFGIIALFFFVLLLISVTSNVKLRYAVVLCFVLNFSFTTANIILEPTMVRMMAAIFCLWLVVRWKEKQAEVGKSLIWKSALICLLFLFSYPTNAFLVLAAYIALVLTKTPWQQENVKWINFNDFWKGSIYFGIGGLISLFIYFLINLSLDVDMLSDIFDRGSKYEGRTGFNPRGLVVNFFKLVLANSFRFNPLWLVVSVLAIAGVFLSKWKRFSFTVFATLLFVGSFMLQTIFVNDFPWRKLIILLPFLLLLVANGCEAIWDNRNNINKKRLISITASSLLVLMLLIYWEQVFFNSHLVPLVTTALGIILIFYAIVRKVNSKTVPVVLFVLLLLPEIYYTMQHYLINPTYHYKNMYKSLSKYDGYNFIGGSSMGFRVYNQTVPLLSKYLYYDRMDEYWNDTEKLSHNGQKDYSIDYDFLEEEYRKIGFKPVKLLMPAENSVSDKDIILYEEIEVK
ncbi:ArnT family glycosyltransferase [Autumnicola psychrophila]|uniref:Glycosyltransferase RgtA/B/C/D-like domain-containing protein n=1 Tax=Autumnicola psychrophila TaxID=3075592 RepID=A0ABU3DSX0_9FLAO|nr:hypothetical protein [Zunongwangia sp. F225]MDT0686579.1 hypothetical protein [Zunongwangia sp. F225]